MSKLLSIGLIAYFLLAGIPAYAHPGNTASDGCHYCRTNCDRWGEVYGARHCHGAPALPPPPPPSVAPTRRPTILPLPSPTPTDDGEVLGTTEETTPTPEPSPEPTPTPTPSPTPSTEPTKRPTPTPIPEPDEKSGAGARATLSALALLGGGGYYLYRRTKQNKIT